ncbi:MAG: molybdopterin molybdotransferase MoeA [Proteobacteria bacterium]|nr:molybdopterin molybdotransferase MoeA [Pseudomonadota bacterium]
MLKESVTLYEALEIILHNVPIKSKEKIDITESLGRFVAEDVYAPYPLPLNDNSAMDGFVVRVNDLKDASSTNPIRLKIVDVITAGKKTTMGINQGECARIFTGGIIPEGADGVIRQEDVIIDGEFAIFKKSVEVGSDIRKRGSDLEEGQRILSIGDRVNPGTIGLCSALRIKNLTVFQKPQVYIIATGSELVDIDSPFDNFNVVNSNSYALSAMVKELDAQPVLGGILKDSKEDIRESFKKAIKYDIIITTGGVSVGEYDLVKDVFAEMGVKWLFWKVKIRPGHPVAFGVYEDKLFFGLPGNPVSAMVTFDQFVRPAIFKMCGSDKYKRKILKARSKSKIKKKEGVVHFIRGVATVEDGELIVESISNQASSAINTMAMANCYIILNEKETRVEPGETVLVEIF